MFGYFIENITRVINDELAYDYDECCYPHIAEVEIHYIWRQRGITSKNGGPIQYVYFLEGRINLADVIDAESMHEHRTIMIIDSKAEEA